MSVKNREQRIRRPSTSQRASSRESIIYFDVIKTASGAVLLSQSGTSWRKSQQPASDDDGDDEVDEDDDGDGGGGGGGDDDKENDDFATQSHNTIPIQHITPTLPTCMTMARAGKPPLLSTVNKNLLGRSSIDTMSTKFLMAPV